jgi:hypothetical protein
MEDGIIERPGTIDCTMASPTVHSSIRRWYEVNFRSPLDMPNPVDAFAWGPDQLIEFSYLRQQVRWQY